MKNHHKENSETEKTKEKLKNKKEKNANTYHRTLGNPSEDITRLTSKL